MAINGNENQQITLEEGATMTKNYRDTVTSGSTIGHFINKSALESALSQTGCIGLRIYYAINSTGGKELVVVGVNQSGNDLTQGIILDRTLKCPQDCGEANVLNSNVTC